jgi:hypothetical protein
VSYVMLECTACGKQGRAETKRQVDDFQSQHGGACEEGSVMINGQYTSLPAQ